MGVVYRGAAKDDLRVPGHGVEDGHLARLLHCRATHHEHNDVGDAGGDRYLCTLVREQRLVELARFYTLPTNDKAAAESVDKPPARQ